MKIRVVNLFGESWDEQGMCFFFLGGYVILDGEMFDVKGWWEFGIFLFLGYDFWYQFYYNVMISMEWGVFKVFIKGFKVEDVQVGQQGFNVYII